MGRIAEPQSELPSADHALQKQALSVTPPPPRGLWRSPQRRHRPRHPHRRHAGRRHRPSPHDGRQSPIGTGRTASAPETILPPWLCQILPPWLCSTAPHCCCCFVRPSHRRRRRRFGHRPRRCGLTPCRCQSRCPPLRRRGADWTSILLPRQPKPRSRWALSRPSMQSHSSRGRWSLTPTPRRH